MGRAHSLRHTGFAPVYTVCAFPVYTAQAPGCSAGEVSKAALGCVHFPGLSRSGSGSRALPKGADLVGPGLCALPRSEQHRRPGAWEARSPEVAGASYHLRRPSRWSGWQRAPVSLLASWSLAATLPKDVNRPESQEVLVSNQKPAHSLVGNAFSWAEFASFLLWLLPSASLPLSGDGPVSSWLALLCCLLVG